MGKFNIKWEAFVNSWRQGGNTRVFEGLKNTLTIAIIGLMIGIVIGVVIAVIRVMPKYRILPKILDKICRIYASFFRGTPIVVQLLVGYYVLFPLMGVTVSSLTTCIIIFGLNSGAYLSETMRAGINSVDSGQLEAARALGLSYSAAMIKIVVPQAVKNILPTIGNELISLIKETSVVSFVGAVDLYNAFRYIGSNNYEFMVPYLIMAMFYIVIVLIISIGIKFMERSLRKSDRRN